MAAKVIAQLTPANLGFQYVIKDTRCTVDICWKDDNPLWDYPVYLQASDKGTILGDSKRKNPSFWDPGSVQKNQQFLPC